MSRDLKAFIWSFSLHAMIIIALFTLGHRMTYSKPILIDFSIEESIDSVKEETKRSSPAQRPEGIRKGIGHQEPKQEIIKQQTEAVKESPVTERSSEEQAPVPATPQMVAPSISEKGIETASNVSEMSRVGTSSSSGNNRVVEAVSSGTVDFTEKARQRYIKEHFAYIRDIITKNISYPFMARKMGWSGRVTVSFIIATDGSVKDIKIIESSGYDILDRNATDTVKKVSPFPRPPVSAEVIVPVVYRLN